MVSIPEFRDPKDIRNLAEELSKECGASVAVAEWLIRQFPQYEVDDYELREVVTLRLRAAGSTGKC